jgi:hypothetical protein
MTNAATSVEVETATSSDPAVNTHRLVAGLNVKF